MGPGTSNKNTELGEGVEAFAVCLNKTVSRAEMLVWKMSMSVSDDTWTSIPQILLWWKYHWNVASSNWNAVYPEWAQHITRLRRKGAVDLLKVKWWDIIWWNCQQINISCPILLWNAISLLNCSSDYLFDLFWNINHFLNRALVVEKCCGSNKCEIIC